MSAGKTPGALSILLTVLAALVARHQRPTRHNPRDACQTDPLPDPTHAASLHKLRG